VTVSLALHGPEDSWLALALTLALSLRLSKIPEHHHFDQRTSLPSAIQEPTFDFHQHYLRCTHDIHVSDPFVFPCIFINATNPSTNSSR